MYLVIISGAVCLLISLPRTLDRLAWMGLLSAAVITLAGFVAMIGAGDNPVPGRSLSVTASSNFYEAFLAVTNPVRTLFYLRVVIAHLFSRFLHMLVRSVATIFKPPDCSTVTRALHVGLYTSYFG